jgi:hypothetical protein
MRNIGFLDDEAATSVSEHRDVELNRCLNQLLCGSKGALADLFREGNQYVQHAMSRHLYSLQREI